MKFRNTGNDMDFSKETTSMVKAFAILYMLAYHLISFPNRIYVVEPPSWFGSPLTNAMSICVPMFLFMAGFGLYRVYERKNGFCYSDVTQRVLNLYKSYWKIFVLFVPLGFIFYGRSFSITDFLLNATALTCSYCGEWWFFSLYIELLFLFPLLIRINCGKYKYLLIIFFILALSRVLLHFSLFRNEEVIWIRHLKMILINISIYMMGIWCAKFQIMELLFSNLNAPKKKYIVSISIICTIIPILVRAYLPAKGITELFIIPLEIFGIYLLSNIIKGRGKKLFLILGKYSTNIWLIHGFFVYYYWQHLVFLPHYIPLIYIWLILLSLLTSELVEYIYNKLFRYLKSQ